MLDKVCYRLKLTVVTPLSVGFGEKLDRWSYYLEQQGGKYAVYIIDQQRFIEKLGSGPLLSGYLDTLTGSGPDMNLTKWVDMTTRGKFNVKAIAQQASRYVIRDVPPELVDHPEASPTLNDMALHIKDYGGRPYLPGSSIKGALRNALVWEVLRHNPQKRREYRDKLFTPVDSRFNAADEVKLLGLERADRDMLSFASGISVSDSTSADPSRLRLVKKYDWTFNSDDGPKKLPIHRECLETGAELECYLSIDRSITGKFLINDWTDVAEALRYKYESLKGKDAPWRKGRTLAIDEPQGVLLNLGAGSGFQYKTLVCAAANDMAEAREETEKTLQALFARTGRKPTRNPSTPSPRTIKLYRTGAVWQEAGWLRLEMLEEVGK